VRLGGALTTTVRIFLSSGDDALEERDFFDALVRDAINACLMDLDSSIRFEVDRWERSAPHKLLPDAGPNDEFVARAKRANLVVSVLIDNLRPGTREELEAALAEDGVEVSVVWCEKRDGQPDSEVSRWLLSRQGQLFYDRAGRPDTTGPKVAFVRLITAALLTALRDYAPRELVHERR
jgi:hypothetical protein